MTKIERTMVRDLAETRQPKQTRTIATRYPAGMRWKSIPYRGFPYRKVLPFQMSNDLLSSSMRARDSMMTCTLLQRAA